MFMKIGNKEELVNILKEKIGEDAVIHYNCENCDDEQVTYNDEITEEMVDGFKDKGFIMTGYPCTNCGMMTRFLYLEYIQGIEFNF